MAVMNQLAEKFAKRDIKGVLSLIAPDSDVIFYAPEVDGRFVGLEGIRLMLERDWSQTKALSFEYQLTSISAAGVVAWVVSDTIFNAIIDGHRLSLPCRVTVILEKRGNKWLIVHGHFSYPNEESFLFAHSSLFTDN